MRGGLSSIHKYYLEELNLSLSLDLGKVLPVIFNEISLALHQNLMALLLQQAPMVLHSARVFLIQDAPDF